MKLCPFFQREHIWLQGFDNRVVLQCIAPDHISERQIYRQSVTPEVRWHNCEYRYSNNCTSPSTRSTVDCLVPLPHFPPSGSLPVPPHAFECISDFECFFTSFFIIDPVTPVMKKAGLELHEHCVLVF